MAAVLFIVSHRIELYQIISNRIESRTIVSYRIDSNQIKSNQIKLNRIESNQIKSNFKIESTSTVSQQGMEYNRKKMVSNF